MTGPRVKGRRGRLVARSSSVVRSPGIEGRRLAMIFRQFLYPHTGCAAYVFG